MRRFLLMGIWVTGVALLGIAIPRPEAGAKPAENPRRNKLTDRHGDTLPEGAVARLGTIRLRHQGRVARLAFLANGRALASLGDDNVFHLWETTTGKEIGRFARPSLRAEGPIPPEVARHMNGARWRAMMEVYGGFSLPKAFSPGGTLAAIADRGNGLWLWDVVKNKLVRRFEVKDGPITSVVFSPDGKGLAAVTGGENEGREMVFKRGMVIRGRVVGRGDNGKGGLHLWDVTSGKELRQMKGIKGGIADIQYSPDGSFLAGIQGHEICLWDVDRGKRIRKYDGHENDVTALAFSPNSKYLASAAQDSTIRLWEVTSEEEVRKFSDPGQTMALAFAPDGKTLASANQEGGIRLSNLATGKEIRQWAGHQAPVFALVFSPDGKTLASGSASGRIALWEAASGKELLPIKRGLNVAFISFAANGRTVTLGGEDGAASHWDLAEARQLRLDKKPVGELTLLAFSAEARLAATVDNEGGIHLCDVKRGKEVHCLQGPEGAPAAAAFSPDGKLLVTASEDQTLRLWSVSSGKEIYQRKTTGRDFQEELAQQVSVSAFIFSPDGKTIVSATTDNKFRFLETTTGKERCHFRGPQSGVHTMALSGNGRLLAGASDEIIRLWNPATGNLCRILLGHQGPVHALAFSPDGKQLASASEDRTVRLWDPASGKELRCYPGHLAEVRALAFSPNGKTLVSGSADATALVWDLTAPPPKQQKTSKEAVAEGMATLWKALANADAAVAFQAMTRMEEQPDATVPFVRSQLPPAAPVDKQRLVQLIADLDQQRYAVRERAVRDLEKLRSQAGSAVRKALASRPSAEARKRLQGLLQSSSKPDTSPEGLRRSRAVELLERVATAEARQVLSSLAKGDPDADLTRDAKAALERLARRTVVK
jgi:WD40 repeat protein